MSSKPSTYIDEDADQDVTFTVQDTEDVYVGSTINIPIVMKNTSDESRSVGVTVTLFSVYYTGVTRTKLRREQFRRILKAKEEETMTMTVSADDYLSDMIDHGYAMKINYLGSVIETKQIYASQDDFRLRTIIPDVVPSKKRVSIGETFKVKTSFNNPLTSFLIECVFGFEAAGSLKPIDISTGPVGAGALAEAEVEITAKRAGECVVISSFECKEMGDLQGQCTVTIDKK